MNKSFIEELFYGLYADKPDNAEIMYYFNALYENVALLADPKYTQSDISEHLCGVVSGLCRAEEIQGFKNGLTHALKLFVECSATPDRTTMEARQEYESAYREESQFAAVLKADKELRRTCPDAYDAGLIDKGTAHE